ncbi:MAG: cyclase family protein [Smithellaceae bacterium]|nr:cyclase family protein [Smithellaceae bacterium]
MMETRWIDATLSLKNGMPHWPGDPPFDIERVHDLDHGDGSNLSRIQMGAHSGTHIDAPIHFLRGGAGVEEIPFTALIGPARVVSLEAKNEITKDDLVSLGIRKGERLLLRTRNSEDALLHRAVFTEDFVYLSAQAAAFLVSHGIRLLGIDYLSVGGYKKDGSEVHRFLLSAGVVIVEGLDLTDVAAGRYDMVCLPLKILGSDGGPARVALRRKATRP